MTRKNTHEKRIRLLARAIDALREANKGEGLNAESEMVARAHDMAALALHAIEDAKKRSHEQACVAAYVAEGLGEV
jgi:hypothetical protein